MVSALGEHVTAARIRVPPGFSRSSAREPFLAGSSGFFCCGANVLAKSRNDVLAVKNGEVVGGTLQ
jgi:hypothetical protein